LITMPKEDVGGGAEMAALERKIETMGVSPRKAIAMGGETGTGSSDKQSQARPAGKGY
jgi:hypothetical protein